MNTLDEVSHTEETSTLPETFSASSSDEPLYATLIGVVQDVRHIPTKTGGNMIVATVESVGYTFRVVIFPGDYTTYSSKIQNDEIIVVDGRVRLDHARGEVSISPITQGKRSDISSGLRSFSISQFHDFARRAGVIFSYDVRSSPSESYYIDVPPFWTRDDLLELKDFLAAQESGSVEVILRIRNTEKSTKFHIADTNPLANWVRSRV